MNNNIFNLSIDIKFCHISYHDADWAERKTKVDYTFWNIISGGLVLEINNKSYICKSGDVILFHPGDSYKAYCHGTHCYFLVTFFNIDIGNTINFLNESYNSGIYSSSKVKKISNEFVKDYQEKNKDESIYSLGLYASFLTFISKLAPLFGSQAPFSKKSESSSEIKLTSLTKYIEKNVEKNLTVTDLAKYMGMSEKYFSSFFHIHIGMTPKQYLTKSKMNYALELLANEDSTLQDIAGCLGFADQYSFSKAFKKYFGEAPGTFRMHYIKDMS